MSLHIRPAENPLVGTVTVPGDKSVSHRAALFAPLADGESRFTGWLEAEDTLRSLRAVEALGATVRRAGEALFVGPGAFPERGAATDDLPLIGIDCGNSGTTTRLLLGLLAGRRVRARLDGDDSLRSRPMARVVEPLRAMGARIRYEGEEGRLPLIVEGAGLTGIDYRLPVASAQLESALLLAGLCAAGATRITGSGSSRDHTEKMLSAMGADLGVGNDVCTIRTGGQLAPLDMAVPGDPSSAAFLLAAAALVPGSRVTVEGLMLNPTRARYLDVMQRMDAPLETRGADGDAVEPVGAVTARPGPLSATTVGGPGIPALIDELPLLAVLAARAAGETVIRDAAELRHKECDRIAATVAGLRALGIDAEEREDGLAVRGRPDGFPAEGAVEIETRGDHRIAMAFAVAGLASQGGAVLDDPACVAVSFPDFFAVVAELQRGDAT